MITFQWKQCELFDTKARNILTKWHKNIMLCGIRSCILQLKVSHNTQWIHPDVNDTKVMHKSCTSSKWFNTLLNCMWLLIVSHQFVIHGIIMMGLLLIVTSSRNIDITCPLGPLSLQIERISGPWSSINCLIDCWCKCMMVKNPFWIVGHYWFY